MKQTVVDSHWHLYICEDENGKDFCAVMDALQERNGLKAINDLLDSHLPRSWPRAEYLGGTV